MNPIQTSFIVVNYLSRAHTLRCIRSIESNSSSDTREIILVDNSQPSEMLVTDTDSVSLIRPDRNLGYGAACHAGAMEAHGDYLFFLNNDTELIGGSFDHLQNFLDAHQDVGLIGPQLIDLKNNRLSSFDYEPTLALKFLGKNLLALFSSRRFPLKDGSLNVPTAVDVVSGACLFIRADLYRDLGGFDPRFFLYCEEEDLALRVRAKGYKVFLVPEAKVMHVGGGSSKNKIALKKEFYISFFKFYRKHYGDGKTRVLKIFSFGQFVWRYLFLGEKEIWGPLIAWFLRGAPESESLRFAPGNIDGPAIGPGLRHPDSEFAGKP